MLSFLQSLLSTQNELAADDRGATAVEYALVVSLIAVVAVTAFTALGGSATSVLGNVATLLH
jgi:Flp pilus assembly pilin Flp